MMLLMNQAQLPFSKRCPSIRPSIVSVTYEHSYKDLSTLYWDVSRYLKSCFERCRCTLKTAIFIAIRDYASTPYIGMTQSLRALTQFKDPVALFFLSSAHRDENFSSSRNYFSYFFRKISSLYLAKSRKYGLLQFWRFHLGYIHHLLLHHKTKIYEEYLRNGAT